MSFIIDPYRFVIPGGGGAGTTGTLYPVTTTSLRLRPLENFGSSLSDVGEFRALDVPAGTPYTTSSTEGSTDHANLVDGSFTTGANGSFVQGLYYQFNYASSISPTAYEIGFTNQTSTRRWKRFVVEALVNGQWCVVSENNFASTPSNGVYHPFTFDLTSIKPKLVTGNGTHNTTASTVTLTRPFSVFDDMLIIADISEGTTTTFKADPTPPTGFTLIGSQEANGVVKLRRYYKVVSLWSSEPTSYQWTFGSSGAFAGRLYTVSGADSADPIDNFAFAESLAATVHSSPSLNIGTSQLVLTAWSGTANTGGGGVLDFTPSDANEIAEVDNSGATGPNTLAVTESERDIATDATFTHDNTANATSDVAVGAMTVKPPYQ